TLPDLLRMRAVQAADLATGAAAKSGGARTPGEMSCILLWMNGGPSHIDTFDPKPDAPQEIRGEFKAIPSKVKGVYVSGHLPHLAQEMDKFSILRSVTSPDSSHETATHYLLTGYPGNPTVVYPAYGSVLTRERGYTKALPPNVLLGSNPNGYAG